MGPRRVGKTVMVYHSIRALLDAGIEGNKILYLSLETPLYTGLPLERLVNYFQELFNHKRDDQLFIYFDEIQYLRDWEIHLKSLVDSFAEYRFVVTGSAAAALRLKSNESGAGRFSDYILPPLTFAEYLMFIDREAELIQQAKFNSQIEELNQEFVNYLNFGGYPEAVFSESLWN
jgi:predicted AAA+ superfamily ATPase